MERLKGKKKTLSCSSSLASAYPSQQAFGVYLYLLPECCLYGYIYIYMDIHYNLHMPQNASIDVYNFIFVWREDPRATLHSSPFQ